MTGQGGWPLNVFLTPEQVPVLRRHLLPARARAWACRAGATCSRRSREAWETAPRRDPRRRRAGSPSASRAAARAASRPSEPLRPELAGRGGRGRCARSTTPCTAASAARRSSRPPRRSSSCCAAARTEMAAHTLRAMASGGMYDQVGGGFARYSVDARWLVPHFEKMLYDNALLARAYLHGWQVTGEPLFRRVCRGDARLGAARDARPRGRLLLRARRRLGGRGGQVLRLERSTSCARRWPASRTPTRRSPGSAPPTAATSRARNILVRGPGEPERLDEWRARLYEVRAQRVWPGLDDKRLTSWNALMISALAEAGAVLERDDYLDGGDGALREFVLGDAARRPRAACCAPSRTAAAAQRLPRGPRLPARGAAHALRGELRAALVRRGARRSPTR